MYVGQHSKWIRCIMLCIWWCTGGEDHPRECPIDVGVGDIENRLTSQCKRHECGSPPGSGQSGCLTSRICSTMNGGAGKSWITSMLICRSYL